jgi:dipeptidyl aminopeptidase/acylaminoacyl peptidase
MRLLKNPRSFHWRDDQPSTVAWIQALDGGDSKKEMIYHDALIQLEAPFSGSPSTIYQSNLRLRNISWCDATFAIGEEGLFGSRKTLIKKFNPLSNSSVDTLFNFSSDDAYHDPGNLIMTKNQYHRSIVSTDQNKSKIFTISQGASEEGNMPFLAAYDLKMKKQEILWRCAAPYYENPVHVIDIHAGNFITSRESITEQPNYYLRNYKDPKSIAITNFPNPQPQLEGVKKEKIQYTRSDGINLTALLYTPKGYDKSKDGPLPVMMWAYPREFKSASDAAQVRGSKYMFTRVSSGSPLFWVLRGYAVMDQTEMPIVGVGDAEPNDTYVQQLVQNAEAAVNKVVDLGVGDRNRIGIGGHSYGAFMTANLLAHCDLFKAVLLDQEHIIVHLHHLDFKMKNDRTGKLRMFIIICHRL